MSTSAERKAAGQTAQGFWHGKGRVAALRSARGHDRARTSGVQHQRELLAVRRIAPGRWTGPVQLPGRHQAIRRAAHPLDRAALVATQEGRCHLRGDWIRPETGGRDYPPSGSVGEALRLESYAAIGLI